jgi:hypothetical protein
MANGNTPVYSGLGARRGISAAGESYLKTIKGAGETISGLGAGLAKVQMEIGRREAEARSMVKDADFTNDEATRSMFAADANEIKDKIGGISEDAYDFSNLNDIARFQADVTKFNSEISQAETIYNEAIVNFKNLENDHNLFVKVGEDPNQAVTTDIPGVGEVYNKKANTLDFNVTMNEGSELRNNRITKSGGKYIMRDRDGAIVRTYNTKEEYFNDLVNLSKPDLQPVPVITGRDKVIKEKWGALYDTETEAESAFVNYVLNNPNVTRRRAQEKSNSTGEFIPVESEMGMELMNRHPSSSAGFDSMTKDQYDYVQEMLQEWRDEQKEKKPEKETKTASGTKTEALIGRIGDINYLMNEDLPNESSIGGTGVALGGQVLRTGEMRGASVQQLIYNPGSETYTVVVTGTDGVEADFELDPSPQSPTRTALMGALGINNADMTTLLREIRRRGQ